jgi:L-amino acid N-acyltransferase YncA
MSAIWKTPPLALKSASSTVPESALAAMKIRTALPSDLPALVAIYNQAVEAGHQTADLSPMTVDDRKEWFQGHPPDTHPIFVAEEGAAVLGYCTISPYRPGRMALRHTAEISYFVDGRHRRRGVASRLLAHAVEVCPSLDLRTLFAIVMETNTASIRLLERHGFRRWGHLPGVAVFDGVEVGQDYYGLKIPPPCG